MITTKTIRQNAMQNIISVLPKFILVTRTYDSSMVTLLICTLAIHPFIWGGADVAGDCLLTNDTHITLMCYQLSYPYIFCTHYPQYNSPSPYIYLISGDQTKGRFCELRPGLVSLWSRWAWRTLRTNLQLPETFKGEWVPIGFENQLSPLSEFGRGARDTLTDFKNINQEEIPGFATGPIYNYHYQKIDFLLWHDDVFETPHTQRTKLLFNSEEGRKKLKI